MMAAYPAPGTSWTLSTTPNLVARLAISIVYFLRKPGIDGNVLGLLAAFPPMVPHFPQLLAQFGVSPVPVVAARAERCGVFYCVWPALALRLDMMHFDPRLLADYAAVIRTPLCIKLDGFKEGHSSPRSVES